MSEKTYPNMGENGHPPGKTFAELYKKRNERFGPMLESFAIKINEFSNKREWIT
jgi:hypothetical protein